jgi:uncharacterized protein (DUF927 family)
MRPRGSLDEWLRVGERLTSWPVVMLTLYACAAAPLLRPLGLNGFVYHLGCETGRGKTTASRFGMSMWGDAERLERSWRDTLYAIEAHQRVCTDLPLHLDDTKLARGGHEQIGEVIYSTGNGKSRMRGSNDGEQTLRTSAPLRNIIVSTGEAGISAALATDGGARARLVEVNLPPLGAKSEASARLATELAEALRECHGTAGLAWLECLVRRMDAPARRARWLELAEQLAADPSVLRIPDRQRMAKNYALLVLAGELLHRALD